MENNEIEKVALILFAWRRNKKPGKIEMSQPRNLEKSVDVPMQIIAKCLNVDPPLCAKGAVICASETVGDFL
jgi:hypothetical protein